MSAESKYYSEEIKKISKIEFNIFTNKEIKNYSAVSSDPFGINLSESYENYEPKKGGLVDLRMGTCDPYLNCTTCGLNYLECPGHFGHIELAEPVFHYGFLDHLKSLLQCVCTKCSNILIEKNDSQFKKVMTKRSEARFKEIRNLTKNANFCWNCGTPVPKIRKEINASKISISLILEREVGSQLQDEKTGEVVESMKKITEVLTPRDCYNILRNVSDTDCSLLGFNPKAARPEDLIISRFPVPPVIIRPTSKIDFLASSTMEDSLTLKISDIVTANQRLRAQLDKETIENDIQNYSNTAHALLQYQVATFFDNESISLPRSEFKTGNPTKSISDRVKGKAGRVRSNLMGKRVDFSGRSVITPDPYINIDQLGVPKKIAMELTIPEEVTPYNIKYLTGLVKNGRDIYPGANFVLRVNYRDGKSEVQKIDLKYRKKAIRLNIGDIVERHAINGDYVLFNRQPTLHKPSMMAHQIHVLDRDDANTFRVNVSACKPYGADFDGDEMNIHLAQSIQARNELKRIANVKHQIIGVKDSNPIIGCQQDALSGAFLLTQKDVKIKGSDAANILSNTSSETKYEIDKDKEYTGQEVFTHIIPSGINTLKKNDKGEVTFQIKDGNLLTGILDKSSLSTAKNSIIHFVWDKYGPNKTRRFIDDVQKLVLNFLLQKGMSISYKDAFLESKFEEQIKKVLDNAVLENKYMLTQYENEEDQISPAIIEGSLYSQMNAIGSDVGATLKKNLNTNNYFWALVTSGAKGSETNLQQMMGCIGQQAIEGKRINKKVEGRSLVFFHKDDDTPEARGFTRSSLLDGLKGYEAFIFTAAGREGLIDTAIKSVTWETPIVIIENNQPKYTEIGKWIDSKLEDNKVNVKHYTDRDMELLDTRGIFIPTMNEQGQVSWGEVTAVTRHDPGKELYEIKTYGGRKVIVTESKSLLIWKDDKKMFEEILTPEIKIGDFLPVTAELSEPTIIKKYIELSDYLSKSEYVYGSDYNTAVRMMKNSMENKKHIESGWWKNNNGKEFSLPYTKKSSLQRCTKRSNQENIKDGYVYPYDAKRENTLVSDKFELNEENGIFLGLFLAEGNTNNCAVRITNTNNNIKNFVRNWFDKQSINYDEEDRINHIGGRTSSIRGFSGVLSQFLDKLVGQGAENKFIPSEAFVAPKEFIKGLINGYFSGDGCITKNSIDSTSASQRLTEGISMLCSRLGIFCKTYKTEVKNNNLGTENIKPSYRIRISAQWADKFSKEITLLEENKNFKMKNKNWAKIHQKFKFHNDVVLDSITEINLVDVSLHPKVYDLTIPSTLNFGLANGLQVRDTAQTGYIQRKLVKGLEDLSIKYDGTNRNSRGIIIQYVYGENGINQASQTEIKLGIMEMDNAKLESVFAFTDEQLKKLEKKHKIAMKDLKKFNEMYVNKMKKYRDEMRNIQQKALMNFKTMEEKFMVPVNLFRITQDYSAKGENLDLTPKDVLDSIEEFLESSETKLLPGANKGNKRLIEDDKSLKFILEIALHEYLSPNKCIFEYGLSKTKLKEIWKEITLSFIKSMAEPGEMVGVLAAQSIGEPTTQLNLNTKHFAGVASKSGAASGVPRLIELLSFSKDIKTPQMAVYFDDNIRSDKNSVNKIASYFKFLSIKQLIDSAEIYYDVGTEKKLTQDNVSTPFFVNNQKAELTSLPFVFRLKMNLEKMLDKETTLLDIKTKFVAYWYKNFTNTKTMKKNEKDIFSKISRCAILSNTTADKEQIIHIRFSMSSFNYQILVDFLNVVLENITLKGIDGISDINMEEQRVLNFNKETGATQVEKEFVVTTSGINLERLKYMKGVNLNRVSVNDIFTIYRNYGIEATRQILMIEYFKVLGDKLNSTHLSLLVDMMTHNGETTSIDRHGLSKLESDPCARASFEQTMDHFINAAIFNEKDTMKSISSNVMLGKVIPGGTGSFDLMLDTNKLENSEYTSDETGGRITFAPLEEDSILKDILKYGINQANFFIPTSV